MPLLLRALRTPTLAILVLLLGLGHACELSVFTDLVASAEAATSHHDHHHHAAADSDPSDSAELVSCDGLAATSTGGKAAASVQVRAATTTASQWADWSVPASRLAAAPVSPPPRRPLFLLFATLLI